MNFKQTTIPMLAAILVLSTTACGSETGSTDAMTTNSRTAQTTENAVDSRQDSLPPDLDFGGETVNLYIDKMCALPEFNAEESGEIVEDAVYHRNQAVEERLNVTLSFTEMESNWADNLRGFCDPLRNSIQAGDGAYDLVGGYGVSIGNLASQFLFTNLCDTAYLDFSMPWWPESLMNDLAVDGKLFFASGDISSNMTGTMFCIMFNKQRLYEYGLEEPYKFVDDGTWTLDKLFSQTKDIYRDLNQNNKADIDDFYGLSIMNTSIDNYYYSSGMNIIVQDPDNGMKISDDFGSEKMTALVELLCNACHQNPAVFLADEEGANLSFPIFKNGNAVYQSAGLRFAIQQLRDVDFDYGVVPMPKWDEAQENYYTTIAYTGTLYAIPMDVKQSDVSSAVMEALAMEGYYTLSPAFFETALKVKYTTGNEAARMFDIMKASLSFDFGRVYQTGKFDGIPGLLRQSVVSNQPNWASTYEKNIKKFETALTKFIEEIRYQS